MVHTHSDAIEYACVERCAWLRAVPARELLLQGNWMCNKSCIVPPPTPATGIIFLATEVGEQTYKYCMTCLHHITFLSIPSIMYSII